MRIKILSGTGNTFIFINLLNIDDFDSLFKFFPNCDLSNVAKKICNHRLIDTDGAVFIVPSKTHNFKWEFFNRDGSSAEMCGNAARCAIYFANKEKIIQQNGTFETNAGTIWGEILGQKSIKIRMTPITNILLDQTIKNKNLFSKFDFLNTGVPHCVIKVPSIENLEELRPLAKELRKPEYFGPEGANITFKVSYSKDKIESISFERGVEDFTEACGTGAVAAAYSHSLNNGNIERVSVSVPGGELLVEFHDKHPYLIGEVKLLKTLTLEELEFEGLSR